ncbi:MAG: hypothetical protein HOP27_06310 [Anaerolineales bacterium]|jgi:hypothetical protein|nr:hypothetical protein [Anaerolineales bacterium]
MPVLPDVRPPRYHHFVLLVWEERNAEGQHVTWRFSLQNSHKEERIGFKNLNDLTVFLERWMETSSEDDSNKKEMTK